MGKNKNKCELITTHPNAEVKFKNGERVPIKEQVTYLGSDINMEGDRRKDT